MSRSAILAAIRQARVPDAPLPAPFADSAPAPDLVAAFTAALQNAAGVVVPVADRAALAAACEARYPTAARRLSLVPEIPSRAVTPAAPDQPGAHADVDLAIVPADFGVAENGAVWIDTDRVSARAALFLAQHLAIVLSPAALVADMHAAYARLAAAPLPGFGVFIAGPSKTADIEQCLVIGAHGPRSLTVFLAA